MLKFPVVLTLRTKFRMTLLLVAAGSLCAISAFYFVRFLVKPFTGLVITFPEVRVQNGAMVYSPRVGDSPALRAGLVPDRDRIIAIEGRPIRSVRELVVWEAGHYSFEPVTVTVSDETGAVRDVVIQPQMSVTQSGWYSTLFFIVVLGSIAIYLLVHYHTEITHVLFAFFALLYMVYTSILPFYYESFFTMLFVNAGEQTVWSILIFLTFFQKDVVSAAVKRLLIAGFSSIILAFSVARFFLYGRWLVLGLNGAYRDVQGVLQLQNMCDLPGYVLFILFLIFIYARSRHRELKHHIEWITVGALLALPSHFFFDQLPLILHQMESNPYYIGNPSNFFLAFLPLSYLIGLVRSRGYQLKVLRSRLVVYIAVAFALLALFAVLFEPTQRLFTVWFKLNADISGFIVALTLFIAALYLQLVVFLIFDRRLLREKGLDKPAPDGLISDDANDTPAARVSRQAKLESDLLLTGLMERFDLFLDRTRKSCLEMQKLAARGAGQPRSAGRKEASEERPVGSGERAVSPGDRVFGSIRKNILALEQFRKRFEVILKRQASIRISLALDALVDSVITQSQRQWSGISFSYQRRPGVKVFCSPEDIAFCFLFAIENAYESLLRKSESILIQARAADERVTVEIADKGTGIPLKSLSQIGQPFFTTKRDHEGLGLFFMKVLLERNNGSWSIEPGIETGARLLLHLPQSKSTAFRETERNP
jgi:signal transduction histidine kinase